MVYDLNNVHLYVITLKNVTSNKYYFSLLKGILINGAD